MKLATLRDGSRDGQLIVVSADLTRCLPVPQVAPTLQQALDRWSEAEPALRDAARRLAADAAPQAQPFDSAQCLSPLPRAYQFLDGSAYLNHVELVRKARGAAVPRPSTPIR